ncbi:hypothetical protein C1646_710152 [Rhizophagus diaphanus]|nr:hypothetical protein C1646_710152 [Rhizophagus diaphanus] [Rhizophagus sp. MUCL 43196]
MIWLYYIVLYYIKFLHNNIKLKNHPCWYSAVYLTFLKLPNIYKVLHSYKHYS